MSIVNSNDMFLSTRSHSEYIKHGTGSHCIVYWSFTFSPLIFTVSSDAFIPAKKFSALFTFPAASARVFIQIWSILFSAPPSRWLLCSAVVSFVYFCVIYSYNWRNDVFLWALSSNPQPSIHPCPPLPERFFSIDALTVKCSLCLHCWPHQLSQSLMTHYTHINRARHKQSSPRCCIGLHMKQSVSQLPLCVFLFHPPPLILSLNVLRNVSLSR